MFGGAEGFGSDDNFLGWPCRSAAGARVSWSDGDGDGELTPVAISVASRSIFNERQRYDSHCCCCDDERMLWIGKDRVDDGEGPRSDDKIRDRRPSSAGG